MVDLVTQLHCVDDPQTNVPRWVAAYVIWLSEKVIDTLTLTDIYLTNEDLDIWDKMAEHVINW